MASIETNMKFVKELLNSEGISKNERQFILGLVEKELIQGSLELKSKLQESNDSKKGIKEKEILDEEYYHNLSKVTTLLSEFTNSNYPVKWLVHPIDSEDYESFDDLIAPVEELNYFNKWRNLQNYDNELWYDVIFPFIFQKELTKLQKEDGKPYGWGRNKIKIGWQYPGIIKDWCREKMDNKKLQHERKYPFVMKIPTEFKPNRNINTFEDLVEEFKKEIRYEKDNLKDEINYLAKKYLKKHNLENQINFVGKFFVNTGKVQKAIAKIFQMISTRNLNLEVRVSNSFNEDNTVMFLNINHLNSTSPNRPDDPALEGSVYGDLEPLIRLSRNVCDFSIESRFKSLDGSEDLIPYRIDYLYDGVKPNDSNGPTLIINPIKDEEVIGFNFRLGFHLLKSGQL